LSPDPRPGRYGSMVSHPARTSFALRVSDDRSSFPRALDGIHSSTTQLRDAIALNAAAERRRTHQVREANIVLQELERDPLTSRNSRGASQRHIRERRTPGMRGGLLVDCDKPTRAWDERLFSCCRTKATSLASATVRLECILVRVQNPEIRTIL